MLPRIYLLEAIMISCISCENAHLFGSAFYSQFQLRYRAFIERQDYDVQITKGWNTISTTRRRAIISCTTHRTAGR